MGLTTDRHDGCLHETDPATGLQKCYLILPDGERQDLVRPVRRTYRHNVCGTHTTMARAIAETYAARLDFYTHTYCAGCKTHLPVGEHGEFTWVGANDEDTGVKVGT